MVHPIDYLITLPAFLGYFAAGLVLLGVFLFIYIWVTPYREFALIAEGNVAPVITLAGALTGFVLPLASVIRASISLADMAVWGVIAMLVQLAVFIVANKAVPGLRDAVKNGQISSALLLALFSVVIGMLNAACMSY